jgi:hypothetical protein
MYSSTSELVSAYYIRIRVHVLIQCTGLTLCVKKRSIMCACVLCAQYACICVPTGAYISVYSAQCACMFGFCPRLTSEPSRAEPSRAVSKSRAEPSLLIFSNLEPSRAALKRSELEPSRASSLENPSRGSARLVAFLSACSWLAEWDKEPAYKGTSNRKERKQCKEKRDYVYVRDHAPKSQKEKQKRLRPV